jgi:hypothetical protein
MTRFTSRLGFLGQPPVVMSLALLTANALRLVSSPLGAISILAGSTVYMIRVKDIKAFFPDVDRFSIPIRYSSGAFVVTQIGKSYWDFQLGFFVALLYLIWPSIDEVWRRRLARLRRPLPVGTEEEIVKFYKSLGRVTVRKIVADLFPWIAVVLFVYLIATLLL